MKSICKLYQNFSHITSLVISLHTMPIAVLKFVSQPQNSLGTHLCAKVSVEGCRSAALQLVEAKAVRLKCRKMKSKSITVCDFFPRWTYLLHVSKDVLTAVKDAFSLLRVQVEDEVSCIVRTATLIPFEQWTGNYSIVIWVLFLKHELRVLFTVDMTICKGCKNVTIMLSAKIACCMNNIVHQLVSWVHNV